ncbi:hypothetical protein GBA52_009287 [Prunus armeniaca]|nr:hypothetical protein GBA52_009287 [Prunus armeniaca]
MMLIHVKKKKDWNYTVNHTYREQNFAADAFSARSLDSDLGLHLYSTMFDFLLEILKADAMGPLMLHQYEYEYCDTI